MRTKSHLIILSQRFEYNLLSPICDGLIIYLKFDYCCFTISKRIFQKFVKKVCLSVINNDSLYRVTVVSMVTTWCWWFTNIFKLSPTYCLSNSSHRHRCNHFKALKIMKSISFHFSQIVLFNISGLFFSFKMFVSEKVTGYMFKDLEDLNTVE